MFNPNARRQYEIDDYDERVECICTIVPIFDDFEQVYGVIGIDTMTCPEREVFRFVSKLICSISDRMIFNAINDFVSINLEAYFSQHEKDFHEGIATLFNTVYLKHRQKESMGKFFSLSSLILSTTFTCI